MEFFFSLKDRRAARGMGFGVWWSSGRGQPCPPMCHGSRGISLAVVFIFLVPFLPLALEAAFGLNGPHV